jgi:hypothetical protein
MPEDSELQYEQMETQSFMLHAFVHNIRVLCVLDRLYTCEVTSIPLSLSSNKATVSRAGVFYALASQRYGM